MPTATYNKYTAAIAPGMVTLRVDLVTLAAIQQGLLSLQLHAQNALATVNAQVAAQSGNTQASEIGSAGQSSEGPPP